MQKVFSRVMRKQLINRGRAKIRGIIITMLISKNELAARHGVTAATVQGWKRRGYLVMRNGKVDVEPTEKTSPPDRRSAAETSRATASRCPRPPPGS